MLRVGPCGPRRSARRFGGPSEPRSPQVASTVAPTGFFRRPSRSKSARTGFLDQLCRPKLLEKGSEERFWSLLGRFWVPRRADFGDSSVILRSNVPTRSKKRRHAKNVEKPKVFIGFSHVRACAPDARIDRKTIEHLLDIYRKYI